MRRFAKRTSRQFITVLGLALALSGAARADEAVPRLTLREAVFARLDLSADEKQQLKQLHATREAGEKGSLNQLVEAKKKWGRAFLAQASDDEMRAAHVEINQRREAYETYRFEGLLEVRKILSPDKRQKFAELFIQYRRQLAERASGE